MQDYPGRVALWSVGVPPSGPMDDLSHRLANALVGAGRWEGECRCCDAGSPTAPLAGARPAGPVPLLSTTVAPLPSCRCWQVGNDDRAAALEVTLTGPTMRFLTDSGA